MSYPVRLQMLRMKGVRCSKYLQTYIQIIKFALNCGYVLIKYLGAVSIRQISIYIKFSIRGSFHSSFFMDVTFDMNDIRLL